MGMIALAKNMLKSQNWWAEIHSDELSQGDYINDCPVPIIGQDFGYSLENESEIDIEERGVIILTQSCDLMNKKAPLVALCPIYTLEEWQDCNPKFKEKGKWEMVRNGKMEGFHMLAGFNGPEENMSSFLVDFHQIYSLPFNFLQKEAAKRGKRKRLISPFLEHFAQSFARFFIR